MASTDLVPSVDGIFARALGVDDFTDETSYQSIPEWDSLGHITLIVELEKALGTTIDDELVAALRSVGAIREFVRSRARPEPPRCADTEVHRGLEGVYVDRSTIASIDGEHGRLEYRGYSIHDLVQHSTFEETSWLLLHGDLPEPQQLAAFRNELAGRRALPAPVVDLIAALADAHPMEVLRTAVSALGALDADRRVESQQDAERAGIRLIAQLPTLIATHHAIRRGCPPPEPDPSLGCAEDMVRMLFGEDADPAAVRFVEQDLILHADHGSNASAFAARVTMGCQTTMHAAITAAIAAFAGSVHGGAAERVIELIDAVGEPGNAAEHVRACYADNRPVMGFGHRVYRTEDPRVRHYRAAARQLSAERRDARGLEIVEAVAQAMEPYARHGVGANVDLYAGLAYRLLGLPDDLAVPIFVAGRMAGWVAQALEQKANNVLIRPLLHYVGEAGREYPSTARRG